jgi:hypothetical protein
MDRMPTKKAPESSPAEKAHTTGRWAETLFRALSARVAKRWQFISFRGSGKGEWRGVVDVLAIRKDTTQPSARDLKRGDLFDLVLVQIKGGSAKMPSEDDCRRLQAVAEFYEAKSVVLFTWVKGERAEFSVLQDDGTWKPSSATAIFG